MSHWEFAHDQLRSSSSSPSKHQQQAQSQHHQHHQQLNLVEHWDSLSPLTDLERQSIHLIQKTIIDKPLPISLTIKSTTLNQLTPPLTRSSSPSNSLRRLIDSNSNSNLRLTNLQHQQKTQSLSSIQDVQNELPTAQLKLQPQPHHQSPISSIDRFNDWFSTISSQIEADSESDYLNHLSILSIYSNACDSLDQAIVDCRGLLNEIDANWKFVNENCKSLERSCQGMLDEQKVLCSIATALNERLTYFRRLDQAQKVLSRPGQAEIVNSQEFLPMIGRLDICLEFMKSNRHFRDADLYLVRFQQCLTRSMTLIKLHYTNELKKLGKQVQEKLQINQQSSSSNLNIEETLLYDKFKTLSEELRPLIAEVEKRYLFDRDEYGALLNEFYSTWFGVRNQLLRARLKVEVTRIQITHDQVPDLISLATTGCNYLRSVCTAEWNLFKLFFPSTGEDELFSYLESLCDHLYDLLRPQILHEPKLDVLCDLATISNALIAMDNSLVDELEDPQSNTSTAFKFSGLLKPILQDIQTRLIFRAQAIIQTEVAHYQPKKDDLDYPNKLIKVLERRQQAPDQKFNRKRSSANHNRWNDNSTPVTFSTSSSNLHQSNIALKSRLPPDEVQETWYPTLRKTLWVLSRLHTYVNDSIFEDFAGEAVGICSESIIKASHLINPANNQASSTTTSTAATNTLTTTIHRNSMIDRELFVIRHLLILKEMIRTLDVVQVERAVDLGPITDVLKEILNPSLKDSLIFKPITLLNKLKNLNSQRDSSRRMKSSLTSSTTVVNKEDNELLILNQIEQVQNQTTKTIDNKSELDLKLKSICHAFIVQSCSIITSNSIDSFLKKCQNFLNLEASIQSTSSTKDLPSNLSSTSTPQGLGDISGRLNRSLINQEWASKNAILDVFRAFLNDLQLGLKIIFNRVSLYFHDDDDDHLNFNLINVLFPSLQEEIMEKYQRFYNLLKFEFDLNNLIDEESERKMSLKMVDENGLEEKKKKELRLEDLSDLNQVETILNPIQIRELIQLIVYRQSC